MSESLKRIAAWAKEHPALSIGIVAALVLVGYLVYKNSGTRGGLSATNESGDMSGLTTGGGGESILPSETIPLTSDNYYYGTLPAPMETAAPSSQYAASPTSYGEQVANYVINPNPFSQGRPLTEKITGNVVANPNPFSQGKQLNQGQKESKPLWQNVTTFPASRLTSILGMQVATAPAPASSGSILGMKVAAKTTAPAVAPVKTTTPVRQ